MCVLLLFFVVSAPCVPPVVRPAWVSDSMIGGRVRDPGPYLVDPDPGPRAVCRKVFPFEMIINHYHKLNASKQRIKGTFSSRLFSACSPVALMAKRY